MRRIFSLFLLVIFLFLCVPASASATDLNDIRNQILKNQFGEVDPLAVLASAPDDGREWFAFALARSGDSLDFGAYAEALSRYLSEKETKNPVLKQKYALILLAAGYESDFTSAVRTEETGKMGLMSYVFGLHLAHACGADSAETDPIIDAILALRKEDGGFSVTGENAECDATAMVLQALAAHTEERADILNSVQDCLDLLSQMQTESGGFCAYGVENPESAAQVTIALTALGIDPFSDARFIKNGNTILDAILSFQTASGSFSHTHGENESAVSAVQVLLALTAYERFEAGESALYDIDNAGSRVMLKSEKSVPVAEDSPSYKLYVCLGIAGAALIGCLVLFLMKKRSPKSYFMVLAGAGLAITLVLLLNFENADAYYGSAGTKKDAIGRVTLSIRCDEIVGMGDPAYVPEDGVLLPDTEFDIAEGDTVYTILEEAVRLNKIQLETSGAGVLVYVEGMGYLYEMQFGELSGWTFTVNGETSSVGCGNYRLSDGDTILWHYTLTLGKLDS